MSRRAPAPPLDLDATWENIRDALDIVFVFPDDAAPAPSLSVTEWTTAYTAVYSWCTTSRAPVTASFPCTDHMAALYQQLEAYVLEVCARLRSQLDGAPRAALLNTYLALYAAFHARAGVAAHITAHLDRHHTTRMRSTGEGWLRGIDSGGKPRSPKKYAKHAQQALVHMFELAPDVAPDGNAWKEAEARAEAGSDPERVPSVGVQALCLRRWRLDVLEPLLLEHPDLLPSISPATKEDRAALERLARSLKEMGLRAKDLRRTALAQLL
jgi:hypothetical protein